jgi:hypothetical protein
MSKPVYIRCPNPKCLKSNPVPAGEEVKEHTCIFCGYIIPPTMKSSESDGNASAKKKIPQFARQRSESKPVNKNMRKPML